MQVLKSRSGPWPTLPDVFKTGPSKVSMEKSSRAHNYIRAYHGFHGMDGMLVHRRLPPVFCQVALTVLRNPFILWVERGTVRDKQALLEELK